MAAVNVLRRLPAHVGPGSEILFQNHLKIFKELFKFNICMPFKNNLGSSKALSFFGGQKILSNLIKLQFKIFEETSGFGTDLKNLTQIQNIPV